jgi:Ni2+-binding GTPase involved in maturation of urease and hydrogenase
LGTAVLLFCCAAALLPCCSNENILVCAPTGAGKTNIAMITVLREIAAHMINGVIQKDAFKVRQICVQYTPQYRSH